MGSVVAICISREKGVEKTPIPETLLVENHGLQDDAHAGPWHRQVSLLAHESIERMRLKMPELAEGAFGENIIVQGLDLSAVRIGDHLQLAGDVLLEITQIGKECHHGCAIRQRTGDCIMPREGLFCRVLRGGRLRPGDEIHFAHRQEA